MTPHFRSPIGGARLAGLLVPALLLACDGGGSGPMGLTPDPIPGPGDYSRSLTSGGLDRSYGLHVPAGWTPGAERPLVLAFHGLQSGPENLRAVSGLDAVADELGVVVAYPAAARGDWNTECLNCGSDAVVDQIDDVGFVMDLVDRIDADVGVDRRRVYAIGISNGALFVHHLACASRGALAGVASVAATLLAPEYVPACGGSRALPFAFFLGSDDTFFPPEGRLAGNNLIHVRLLSIEESVATWVGRNGCAGAPVVTELPDDEDDGPTVTRHRHAPCADGAEVVYYSIQGGGHTWPGSPTIGGGTVGRVSREISASATAVRFFLDHAR
ncbi:MAG TPA: PHB depolymerase family esterase [Gemmatimonadota bacterium]|nr:PHB depolymerase family esterase [Gemmatimonadota bacterium]